MALRIDVVLAADEAEDHPLRIGRAVGLAQAGLALGGRPLHGIDVDFRAFCIRVLRAQGHDFQRVLALCQAVLVAEDLLVAGHGAPEVDAAKLLHAVEIDVGAAAVRVGAPDEPHLVPLELEADAGARGLGHVQFST